ncbi:MAG: PfkB family carbohydrate kinase [Coriobacteriia bacterium]|nr:PfkB family carbohydrate kinase [Coriobacteriia bacterium]
MTKRVAVLDDIAGFGKCSLGIAIPVLNAAGIEVYPGITSLYSTHTPIKSYTKLDTGTFLDDTIASWKKLNVNFDAILTAALTSKEQIYACMQLFADNPNAIKVVDPVLGDFGDFYDDDFKALLPHLKKLCAHADIITPNQTESVLLTDGNPEAITELGAKNAIVTGLVRDDKIINTLINSEGTQEFSSPYIDEDIHGAGDLFDSALVAKIAKGTNIEEATDFATKITFDAVKLTVGQADFKTKGIAFEPVLKEITNI